MTPPRRLASDLTARAARGRLAEDVAADFLFARGFALLGRNVRVGRLEIDLVARRGALVALVEVRTRSGAAFAGPLESVAGAKRLRLLDAAERLWRGSLAHLEGVDRLRIDVAAVTFGRRGPAVELVEGAVARGL